MVSSLADQLIAGFGIVPVFDFFPGVGVDHIRYKFFPGEISEDMQNRDAGAIQISQADSI
jgi:hypothetical protein